MEKSVIEYSEEVLNLLLNKGKVIEVERVNGKIISILSFNNKIEYAKHCNSLDSCHTFKTKQYGYMSACNRKFADYLEENTYPNIEDDLELTTHFINLKPFHEVVKDINADDFYDGLYDDLDGLVLKVIDGQKNSYTFKTVMGDNIQTEVDYTIEIYL